MTKSLVVCLAYSAGVALVSGATIEMDSGRGARVFDSEGCVQCHAINGNGGHVAPDLGRSLDRSFTPAALASTMWNHAPTMWAAMGQKNVQRGNLDEQGSADLFAFFLFRAVFR